MPPLTTHKRVAHRTGIVDEDVKADELEEFIEDAQALIEGETERTYEEADSTYTLARAACTDLAAAYAMIRMLGGKYSGLEFHEDEIDLGPQQNTKIQLINKYIARTNAALKILNRGRPKLMPRSTTE